MIPAEEISLLKKDLIQWIEGLNDPGILGVLAHLKVEFNPETIDEAEGDNLIPTKILLPQETAPGEELLRLVNDWIAEVENRRED